MLFIELHLGVSAMSILGVIGKLDEVEGEEARFYAYIGLCVSSAAGIEHTLFQCFNSAAKLTEPDAVKKFYKDVRFQRKRELTDIAVRSIFTNPPITKIWNGIIEEIKDVCGPDGARNLVSHNPLSLDFFINKSDEDFAPIMELSVSQNQKLVTAGIRKPERHTLASLRTYSANLTGAYLRLIDFHHRYLANRQ
jgi:hypothetical protein